jgi:hypothetical protein
MKSNFGNKRVHQLGALAALVAAALVAHSQDSQNVYLPYPNSVLALGANFDPANPLTSKDSCLAPFTEPGLAGGALTTGVQIFWLRLALG